MRQVMDIKPGWLLEVAPHFFKCVLSLVRLSLLLLIDFHRPADLEQLGGTDKKMPKAIGSAAPVQ
jgi:pre-mRNA-splicing factor ATP-dependent RNA helicase DHX16